MSRTIDRRTLLRGAFAGSAVALAGGLGLRALRRQPERWDEAAFPPPGDARVAVLAAPDYDGPLESTVLDGLRAIGADVRGANVLLKPNLVEFDPTTAVNTDPRLIAASVLALRRLGAVSVRVGEGPGHRRDVQDVVTRSGLADVLAAVDARFVDLNTAAIRPVRLRSRYTDLGELWLPTPVLDADVVVSMPKMKTHHWAGVTLSLKNLFGTLPGRVYGWPKNILHGRGSSSRSWTSQVLCGRATRSSTGSSAWRATDRSPASRSRRESWSSRTTRSPQTRSVHP